MRTAQKYLEFMIDLHENQPFKVSEIRIKHGVAAGVSKYLADLGYIVRIGKESIWQGNPPTLDLSNRIIKSINKDQRERLKLKREAAKLKNQLAIPAVSDDFEHDAIQILKNSEKYDYKITRTPKQVTEEVL